ncbi:MAG: hypothetical protein C4330_07600 [Chitinophagaceae bacterium]
MKKVLGLDIGTTSIGWAIVEATDERRANLKTGEFALTNINNERTGIHKDAVGVRIISQDTERFDRGQTLNDPKGSTLTPAANRRKYRSSRRTKSRYKLRRDKLNKVLQTMGIHPDENYFTNKKGKRGENNDLGGSYLQIERQSCKRANFIS